MYCRYGKIVSTKAILDKQTNLCKGECIPEPLIEFQVSFCHNMVAKTLALTAHFDLVGLHRAEV